MGITANQFKASAGWVENFKHRVGIRRGFYVGNGTAATAMASAMAPGSASSSVHPYMTTAQPLPDQTASPRPPVSIPPPVPVPPSVPITHSIPARSPSSLPSWHQAREQSLSTDESSTSPHSHRASEQLPEAEYQPPDHSLFLPRAGVHSERTMCSSSEISATSTTPPPNLDDQPIRTIQEAEVALRTFLDWTTHNEDILTADEYTRIYLMFIGLVPKTSGII